MIESTSSTVSASSIHQIRNGLKKFAHTLRSLPSLRNGGSTAGGNQNRSQIFDRVVGEKEAEPCKVSKDTPLLEVAHSPQFTRLNQQASQAMKAGDHEAAADCYADLLELAGTIEIDFVVLVRLGIDYSNCLRHLTREREALTVLCEASALMEELQGQAHDQLRADLSFARAEVEFDLGNYSEAENSYIEAINRFTDLYMPDKERLGTMYARLGALYHEAEYTDQAVEILIQAMHHFDEAGTRSPEMVQVARQLALVAARKNELDAAEGHLKEAINLARKHFPDEVEEIADLEMTLATIHFRRDDFGKSSEYYASAIRRLEALPRPGSDIRRTLSLLYSSLAMVQSRAPGKNVADDCFARSLDLQIPGSPA